MTRRLALTLLLAAPLLAACGTADRQRYGFTEPTRNPLLAQLRAWSRPLAEPAPPAIEIPPDYAVVETSVWIEAPPAAAGSAQPGFGEFPAEALASISSDVPPRRDPGILVQPMLEVRLPAAEEAPAAADPPATLPAPAARPAATASPAPAARAAAAPAVRAAPTLPIDPAPAPAPGERLQRRNGSGYDVL
ncbi:hypothetical protein [Salinarimonas ramus]|uniref:Beta-barrel assembly machine subunit BamF n=1 Tax=Salinarimonas ramus TaxID=690164 RepID=A0A917V1C2_9HYPH|nr:hypothetical protein [Salinarimonas ramus]GGK18248.1 hypothetical protein GCM10011322_01220 [Salinarimonas ramus]